MKHMAAWVLGMSLSSLACGQAATIAVGTSLNIIDTQKSVTVNTVKGPITITRTMTACAKNGGNLQPLVPVTGVQPVGEIEILEALSDRNAIVLDMRGIPYTEVTARMNELGCKKNGSQWNCESAKKVYAFCNGPVCPQSPMAIKAMTRDGFQADKIYYYRGGMLDWDALGLTSVKDEF